MSDGALQLHPITLRDARRFVDIHHRHHRAPQGGLFAVAVQRDGATCGVAIVGKPVARWNNDGVTAEVTRVATTGECNACSMLYAAAWRACRALGYQRLLTYTLKTEPGTSLIAAGWRVVGEVAAGSWSRPSRPRADHYAPQDKLRWQAAS